MDSSSISNTAADPYPVWSNIIDNFGSDPVFIITGSIFVFILLIFSGIISGSEVAFFSLSSIQKERLKTSENRSEQITALLLQNPRRLLASLLVCNNLVNVGIVMLSDNITITLLGTKDPSGWVVAIFTFVVTFLIVFFGEVLPKVYANHKNLEFSSFFSPVFYVIAILLQPISWLLLKMGKQIENNYSNNSYEISVDELSHAIEITSDKETTEEQKDILKGIVQLSSVSVKQIMRSRLDISAFDLELNFHQLMDQINKTGYSRVPIYKESIDKVEGVLYIKDLLPHIDKDENFNWHSLIREAYFVPETKKLDDLLHDFQERRVHMALVIDEYAGISGLVTMEDIIEEIVGEINDEFDVDDLVYSKLDDKNIVFEGKTSLNDVCRVLEIDPDYSDHVKGESESLGGLILELAGKFPKLNEKTIYKQFRFTVESVDKKRVKRVKVTVLENVESALLTEKK